MSNYRDSAPPLGVGAIATDAVSIFFQRFGLMFTLAIVPTVLAFLVTRLFPSVTPQQAAADASTMAVPAAIATITAFLGSSLATSLIVLAAFDTKIGRVGRTAVYIQRTLAT